MMASSVGVASFDKTMAFVMTYAHYKMRQILLQNTAAFL